MNVDPSPLSHLPGIVAALNLGPGERKPLVKALEGMALALNIPAASVYARQYRDQECFELIEFAHWPVRSLAAGSGVQESWVIGLNELGARDWVRLDTGELLVLPEESGRPEVRLAPVRLDEDLFGLLAFWGRSPMDRGPDFQQFLESCLDLLELWISRENMHHEMQDILRAVPIPTMIEDTKGRITAWNPAMEARTGWKAERILFKGNYIHAVPFYYERRPMASDLMMYPDPEWESVYVEFQRHSQTTSGMSLCPNLPGGPIYFSFDASFCYDINHRLKGVIEFITDVTEEREVRRELRRSESLYRTVTDFAGVGIILFSFSKIIYMNKYVAELLKVPAGSSDIQNLQNLIHPEDYPEVLSQFESLFQAPYNPAQFEFRACPDCGSRHYRGFAGLLDFDEQATIHFIFDDITLQKELAEKARLHELRLYHEDRLTSLGIMAAGIAHELNQPLNTIRVVNDGLKYGMEQNWSLSETELLEELDMISRQVQRMSKVIQNIRDFARGDQAQTLHEVDINQAVENVFSMIGRQLEARGINVHLNLDPNLPRIKANLHRLEQVIMNLLVNARQALQGSARTKKKLWVCTGHQDGVAVFEVGDNATGIPAEIAGNIFDPFVTTKEVGQGTGLGLSISKSIMTELKGDMTFFNNHLNGATFRGTLPVRQK
ncbi:MAG: PAS domain-containing protein [Desulfohalobiaceae bacterium]|nr:PAS domain-containing protein [Desulfohalobiaceae bacterium]